MGIMVYFNYRYNYNLRIIAIRKINCNVKFKCIISSCENITIPEEISDREKEYVYLPQYLFRNRILFLGEDVCEATTYKMISSLLVLEAFESKRDIKIYINST